MPLKIKKVKKALRKPVKKVERVVKKPAKELGKVVEKPVKQAVIAVKKEMGGRSSKTHVVHTGISQQQFDELKRQLGDSNAALTRLQQTQQQRERERQAEQQRMQKQMNDTQKRLEGDRQRQAEEMNELRTEHARRITEIDQERQQDRVLFEDQIKEMKEQSEETVKRMTVEKLEQRREIVIRQIMNEREHYDVFFQEYSDTAIELTRLSARISAEESRLEKFMDVRHDPDCLRIVLFGKTGHGKSSVGCRMIGDRTLDMSGGGFEVSADTQSVTQSIKGLVVDPKDPRAEHLNYKQKFLVIDVPGTGETRGTEVASQHANRMVQYLKGIEFINTVGVVQSGTDTRCSGDTINMLRSLVAAFGNEVWPYVVLIITKVRSDYDYRDSRRMEMARREIDEWIEKFRNEIRKQFGLSEYQAPLPAVKIDNKFERDYSEKCSTLVNTYASRFQSNPFRCTQLSSELDDWRNDRLKKEIELNERRDALSKSVTVLNAMVDEVSTISTSLNQKVGDEYVDLITKAESLGADITLMYPIDMDGVMNQIEGQQIRVFNATMESALKSAVIEDDCDSKVDETLVDSSGMFDLNGGTLREFTHGLTGFSAESTVYMDDATAAFGWDDSTLASKLEEQSSGMGDNPFSWSGDASPLPPPPTSSGDGSFGTDGLVDFDEQLQLAMALSLDDQ